MKFPTRIYYTEADKALMWDRWQKGDWVSYRSSDLTSLPLPMSHPTFTWLDLNRVVDARQSNEDANQILPDEWREICASSLKCLCPIGVTSLRFALCRQAFENRVTQYSSINMRERLLWAQTVEKRRRTPVT